MLLGLTLDLVFYSLEIFIRYRVFISGYLSSKCLLRLDGLTGGHSLTPGCERVPFEHGDPPWLYNLLDLQGTGLLR